MTELEALQELIRRAGSQQALGDVCDRTQPSVWGWLHLKKRLPAEHVLVCEAAFGVSRHVLRPDIYPRERAAA